MKKLMNGILTWRNQSMTKGIGLSVCFLFCCGSPEADTLSTSGSGNVSITPTNMYSYCVGDPICGGPNIDPHAKIDNAVFDMTLVGLAVPQGASQTSATFLFSSSDWGTLTQVDNQAAFNPDPWNVNTGAGLLR
jgi:hypothetical protein